GRPGAGMVTSLAFGIPVRAVDFWIDRLRDNGRTVTTEERFGEPIIQLNDPHGLPLELIGMDNPPSTGVWAESPVDAAHGITGIHSAAATLNSLEEIRSLLTEVMGMTLQNSEKNRFRFRTDSRHAPGHFYDIMVDPKAPAGRIGTGTVHHIAFRTENDEQQATWRKRLHQAGLEVTGVRDRKYFRSIYFHSPGGVLFEIATDPPGFEVDESASELGKGLMLPRQYKSKRGEIENRLPVLA
ncbi:MAG: ring-cleaving dioxygenase, partial [Desulfococcaceae bacterium]